MARLNQDGRKYPVNIKTIETGKTFSGTVAYDKARSQFILKNGANKEIGAGKNLADFVQQGTFKVQLQAKTAELAQATA